ncbi:MAG: hypothetical protein V7K14_25450 [Nostoc sp.]|uniref:hypothetical protein n=1 Tax=Nostoc sp. TaxID=1180 RepID=UPI002FFBCA43
MSDQKTPATPEVDFLDGKSIEEATEEIQNDLLGNKTIEEATDEVIKDFGGIKSRDEIRKIFD